LRSPATSAGERARDGESSLFFLGPRTKTRREHLRRSDPDRREESAGATPSEEAASNHASEEGCTWRICAGGRRRSAVSSDEPPAPGSGGRLCRPAQALPGQRPSKDEAGTGEASRQLSRPLPQRPPSAQHRRLIADEQAGCARGRRCNGRSTRIGD
jgi:hypothetical protein